MIPKGQFIHSRNKTLPTTPGKGPHKNCGESPSRKWMESLFRVRNPPLLTAGQLQGPGSALLPLVSM